MDHPDQNTNYSINGEITCEILSEFTDSTEIKYLQLILVIPWELKPKAVKQNLTFLNFN